MRRLVLAAGLLALASGAQAKGRVEAVTFDVPFDGRPRAIQVRTPAAPGDSASLLIVFDGPQYLDEIPLPPILDSLEALGRIPPTVAVLIDNGTGPTRIADLGNRRAFADWLCDRLVPWVRARYQVASDPHRVTAYGSSAGGLAAAFVAFERPDVVGNALSQSGAFWRNAEAKGPPPWEWFTGRVASSPRKDVRFVLDVGAGETLRVLGGKGPTILDTNRRLRDALRAKGYDFAYIEVPGGTHSPESWLERLPAALDSLRLAP